MSILSIISSLGLDSREHLASILETDPDIFDDVLSPSVLSEIKTFAGVIPAPSSPKVPFQKCKFTRVPPTVPDVVVPPTVIVPELFSKGTRRADSDLHTKVWNLAVRKFLHVPTAPVAVVQPSKFYIKFINKNLEHRGLTYKLGLNVDPVPFNGSGMCMPGGIYFTEFKNWNLWSRFGNNAAIVTIPSDARVYREPCGLKLKADKIEIVKMFDRSGDKNQAVWEKNFASFVSDDAGPTMSDATLASYGNLLQHVSPANRTAELCLAAVTQNGFALRYVIDQTPEICLAAVTRSGMALIHVIDQTPEICLAAVANKGSALYHVKTKTPELCMTAVKQDGVSIRQIPNQTPELCMAALESSPWALKYIRDISEDYCLFAVSLYGRVLDIVPEKYQTGRVCLAAIKNYGMSIRSVKVPTSEMELAAVTQNGMSIRYISDPSPEICQIAVEQCGFAIRFIKDQTPELCMTAVKRNGRALKFVKNQTEELCIAAVVRHSLALQDVNTRFKTDELCQTAVTTGKHPWSPLGCVLSFVNVRTPELCMDAVTRHGMSLGSVEEQTDAIRIAAVSSDGRAIRFVKDQTPELCMVAVNSHRYALNEINVQTPELCMAAVSKYGVALEHVRDQTLEICVKAVSVYPWALRFVKCPKNYKFCEEVIA